MAHQCEPAGGCIPLAIIGTLLPRSVVEAVLDPPNPVLASDFLSEKCTCGGPVFCEYADGLFHQTPKKHHPTGLP